MLKNTIPERKQSICGLVVDQWLPFFVYVDLKATAHWPIFCRRAADFLNQVKICQDISLPHTNQFFVATNRI